MKAMVLFPKIVYIVVSAICVFVMVVASVSRKEGGFRDGVRLMTALLACFCGILVSIVYFVENRALSGVYVVHLSFAVSPLFLWRMFEGETLRCLTPLVVSGLVVTGVILSFFHTGSLNFDKWLPPLMAATLLVLLGRNIWRLTDGRGRFDAVAVCREWMLSFVDMLYYAILVLLASVGAGVGAEPSWGVMVESSICVVFLVGIFVAMWLRMRGGRAFLLVASREESYLGNINRNSRAAYMGSAELGLSGEELIARLREYFDKNMPYLDPELTLTDVAKALVTNKVYLSRAINDITGQNFCQFVNFYRVRYAIKLFNCNNAYKVVDLASRSGFNCVRSFIMAFHLYMNMSPSRWCKQNMGKHSAKVLRN